MSNKFNFFNVNLIFQTKTPMTKKQFESLLRKSFKGQYRCNYAGSIKGFEPKPPDVIEPDTVEGQEINTNTGQLRISCP